MRKLVVFEPFSDRQLGFIKDAAGDDFELVKLTYNSGEDVIKNALKDAEIVVGAPDPKFIQEPEINCPELKLIQMTWAGTDLYTRNAIPFPKGISLANASGAYGLVISQFVIAQILSLMLHFPKYTLQQENKIWERRGNIKSLERATVLIYGSGDIGTNTAKRLTGFDTHTIGVCKNLNKKREYFDEMCTLDEAIKHIPEADVIICCIPNTSETEGYFDASKLKLMKQDAIIVNVGRGNFIDNMALNEELNNGHLFGAALDVTNPEPLPSDHPLWENPKCLITPHASGVGFGHLEETVDLIRDIACTNIKHYLNGEEIINRIY